MSSIVYTYVEVCIVARTQLGVYVCVFGAIQTVLSE